DGGAARGALRAGTRRHPHVEASLRPSTTDAARRAPGGRGCGEARVDLSGRTGRRTCDNAAYRRPPDREGPRMPSSPAIPDVLASRYASTAIATIWSPEHKIVLERQL